MSSTKDPSAPIGVFDSGVGGLSVLRALRETLPGEEFIFLADQAHVPYGRRSLDEVGRLTGGAVRFLFAQDVKLIVVACNTASAAALHSLRAEYPTFPFVGMEPAVKPAAENSASGVVGVLATPTTFQGELYASVVERFAKDTTVLQNTVPGLVAEIEAGRANGPEAQRILNEALQPMLAQGIDAVVFGCTHFPFSSETIRAIVGPSVRLIDPAPAIARRVQSLLVEQEMSNPAKVGKVSYLTSGDTVQMRARIKELLGEDANVEGTSWRVDELSTDAHR
jgi:glutamate racemase